MSSARIVAQAALTMDVYSFHGAASSYCNKFGDF
jgi:hypothetical protein